MSHAFSPELERLVQEKMAGGDYASQDELLVSAIHAMEELQSRQKHLRQEIRSRLARAGQGLAAPLDLSAFKTEARQRSENEK